MKTKIVVAEPKTLATELYEIQQEKAVLEEKEKELKDELLTSLKSQGVSFVRLDNGTSFTRSHRETLETVDEEKAREWAEKNNCLKVDTTKAWRILRREMKLPKFFKRKIGADYLTIKRVGEQDDE